MVKKKRNMKRKKAEKKDRENGGRKYFLFTIILRFRLFFFRAEDKAPLRNNKNKKRKCTWRAYTHSRLVESSVIPTTNVAQVTKKKENIFDDFWAALKAREPSRSPVRRLTASPSWMDNNWQLHLSFSGTRA